MAIKVRLMTAIKIYIVDWVTDGYIYIYTYIYIYGKREDTC